jgi:D-ribulokinase
MKSGDRLFLGIDLGTGGARAMAVSESGEVAASKSVAFEPETFLSSDGRREQSPQAWWQAVCQATSATLEELSKKDGSARDRLTAVAVDGTSGTLVVLNGAGEPLRPALMYDDPRSSAEADALNDAAGDFCRKLGYRFNASFALPKIFWIRNNEPAIFQEAARFVHQADYIVQRLTGLAAVSDYSNALKTGYDLIDERWPAWIDQQLGIESRLPRVVAPGSRIGTISKLAAAETGLPEGLPVVAGATDGTAAFLASGARRIGDYNTTLGATLVFKGISAAICRHPQGVIYCHKLPGGGTAGKKGTGPICAKHPPGRPGKLDLSPFFLQKSKQAHEWWLPGAASNVGSDWIAAKFPRVDVQAMDALAAERLPIEGVAYPLIRLGERFPFLDPDAHGFYEPDYSDPADAYAACLQGVALVERLGYQTLDAAAAEQRKGTEEIVESHRGKREGDFRQSPPSPLPSDAVKGTVPFSLRENRDSPQGEVYSTGGGSRSDVWMQCRADATGRVIHRPSCGESAFGSAILAAAGTHYNSIVEAVERMVRLDRSFSPDPRRAEIYNRLYDQFCCALRKRGHL